MRTFAKIDAGQIEEMDLAITFRMSVKEWRSLMRAMPREWPSWKVSEQISSVLGHIARSTDAQFECN